MDPYNIHTLTYIIYIYIYYMLYTYIYICTCICMYIFHGATSPWSHRKTCGKRFRGTAHQRQVNQEIHGPKDAFGINENFPYVYIYLNIYIYLPQYIYIYIYMYIYIFIYLFIYIYIYTYIWRGTCIKNIYIYIHIVTTSSLEEWPLMHWSKQICLFFNEIRVCMLRQGFLFCIKACHT